MIKLKVKLPPNKQKLLDIEKQQYLKRIHLEDKLNSEWENKKVSQKQREEEQNQKEILDKMMTPEWKNRLETLQKKREEEQRQREMELERQRELQRQREREIEEQRQREIEEQRQREIELQRQREIELQRQREIELQRQKQRELQIQRQREIEEQNQRERELQIQRQRELQIQRQRERELQIQRQREREEQNQRQRELQIQNQREMQIQKQQEQERFQQLTSWKYKYLLSGNDTLNRTFIPQNNNIDLHKPINQNINSKKTIIHVLDYSNGFGDYLRGTIALAQYAKYFNIHFNIDVSRHHISKCLNIEAEYLSSSIHIHKFIFYKEEDDIKMYQLIQKFIQSDEEHLYITTNLFYNKNLVTKDIKDYINTFFTFKPKYYDLVNQLFPLKKYNVLHIRCSDDTFDTDFEDIQLLMEIIKLQLDENTIVLSNCYSLKRKINKLFGFYFIDLESRHTAKVSDESELDSTILEYIILSRSSQTYCFSYYPHGSGFSEQCSVLNDIPYSVVYAPSIEKKDTSLLINYYNDILEGHITIKNNENNENIDSIDLQDNHNHNDIGFITLTNTGYIDYTLNCYESIKKIHLQKDLLVYCIGKEGFELLKQKGIPCEFIDDENANEFQEFRKNKWSNVTYYKFEIIYENLLKYKYVCFTDGDIVYENNKIFDFLMNNIKDNDMLIQSEGLFQPDVCSGFMFIKSNTNTIAFFDPINVYKYKNVEGWGDQKYVNSFKYKLKYKKLPLKLFPTGNYFYTYDTKLEPYLIHFNWVIGNDKKKKMLYYNKWIYT
jgi:hypothetical protein